MAAEPAHVRSLAEECFGLRAGSFRFESRFLDVAGARVHYVDEGSGPVLLMLHGNPTWSFVFRHVIAACRDRFRCIALDLPGFGLSTAPPGYGFLPQHHARVVAEVVDALDLRAYTPVVQDWGGPIGMSVASRHPDRIERLVIGNTWCWPVNGDPHFELFSRAFGGPVGTFAIRHANAFVNLLVPAGIKHRPLDPDIMAAYRRALPTPERRMPSAIFPRSILRSRAFLADAHDALAALAQKPALILWGDADIAFRPRERERFEKLLPHHQTVVLHGAGHYLWEDAPDGVVSALRDWWPGEGPKGNP